jgi:hypothetical protein
VTELMDEHHDAENDGKLEDDLNDMHGESFGL